MLHSHTNIAAAAAAAAAYLSSFKKVTNLVVVVYMCVVDVCIVHKYMVLHIYRVYYKCVWAQLQVFLKRMC